jgi:hypothetical protein
MKPSFSVVSAAFVSVLAPANADKTASESVALFFMIARTMAVSCRNRPAIYYSTAEWRPLPIITAQN